MTDNQLAVTTCAHQEVDQDTGVIKQCDQTAISATNPYCYKHLTSIARAAQKHQRYGNSMPTALKEGYEHQLEDTKPLDLVPEILNLRALVTDHLEQLRQLMTENGNPAQLTPKDKLFISELFRNIGKLAEIDARINPRDFMPIGEVKVMLKGIIEIISKSIPSADIELRTKLMTNIKKFCVEQMSSQTVQPLARGPKQ